MASHFVTRYHIPNGFKEILADLTTEILRWQPSDLEEFAAEYFHCLEKKIPFEFETKLGLKPYQEKTNWKPPAQNKNIFKELDERLQESPGVQNNRSASHSGPIRTEPQRNESSHQSSANTSHAEEKNVARQFIRKMEDDVVEETKQRDYYASDKSVSDSMNKKGVLASEQSQESITTHKEEKNIAASYIDRLGEEAIENTAERSGERPWSHKSEKRAAAQYMDDLTDGAIREVSPDKQHLEEDGGEGEEDEEEGIGAEDIGYQGEEAQEGEGLEQEEGDFGGEEEGEEEGAAEGEEEGEAEPEAQ